QALFLAAVVIIIFTCFHLRFLVGYSLYFSTLHFLPPSRSQTHNVMTVHSPCSTDYTAHETVVNLSLCKATRKLSHIQSRGKQHHHYTANLLFT
uniref:Uncharacterized protein n=2 Tax=Oreochromis TaxID=8139 RepID=A0A669BPG8_ORENI